MNASDPNSQRQTITALLRWYADMGVDDITGAVPVARYRAPGEAKSAAGRPGAAQKRMAAAPKQPDEIATARTLAARCQSVSDLKAAMAGFDLCPLKETANSLVFADGNPDAALMVIGEAPGQEEDRKGKPFVGRSGQLLDRMLAAIGLTRETCYITNILPWRPPLNRKPDLSEIQMCLPFLIRHIELTGPQIILTLGGTASQHLLGTEEPMRRLRGQWRQHSFGSHEAAILPTYHPAYLLRNPISKRAAWADMLLVKLALAERAEN